jgi:hypothetical protein
MVIAKKEQTKFCFKTLLNWCLINILNNASHLMGEGHLNSYFYRKLKSYKMCNGSKSRVRFNIVVGFENWNTKIQPTLIGIWNHTCVVPIVNVINKICVHLILLFLKSKLWNNHSNKSSNELQKYLYMREGSLFVLFQWFMKPRS